MLRNLLVAFSLIIIMVPGAHAQREQVVSHDTSDSETDLMQMLDQQGPGTRKDANVTAIFKATRIINGPSIQNLGKGVLDFRISHRFGPVNQGVKDFFGLDGATTHLGFDYGITDWLMVGIGRSTYQKEVDGFVKARLLNQTESGSMPFSLSYVGSSGIQTADVSVTGGREYYFSNRVAYTNQLLIARKFSSSLSLQLMPTHVHYNIVSLASDPNEVFAMGIGGRVKLSHRISLTGEYYYTLPGTQLSGSKNSLSFGIDVETGGHVFQLLFTNAIGISERTFIGQTTGDWGAGDIHFGFNISRVFTIVKPKGLEGTRNKIW